MAMAALAITGVAAVAGRAVAHARAARVADAVALAAAAGAPTDDPLDAFAVAADVAAAHGVALDGLEWRDGHDGPVVVACVRADGARACAAAGRTLSS